MLKTTSLASVIGLFELTYTASVNGSQSFTYFELLIVATFYYLLMTTLWGYIQNWIERRMDPDRSGKFEQIGTRSFSMRLVGLGSPKSGVR